MILITGGTGYLGSHACVAFVQAGHEVLLLDNGSNSSPGVLDRLQGLLDCSLLFCEGDVRDAGLLRALFQRHHITAVIHFAGLKAVGMSVQQPLAYYENNVAGTLCLLQVMQAAGCRRLVFSSSATVYGQTQHMPLNEDAVLGATNPYGRSKLMAEQMMADLESSDASWRIARLRYFNPVGAHESGLIGESPRGIPNNLMPYVAQVATGEREDLQIFGDDYPTPDGTGVRDYIHVMDLAQGHVAALSYLERSGQGLVVNLGTGCGTSVRELVRAFERASGREIPCRVASRRPGDVAISFADVRRAEQLLGWKARRSLDEMCADAWRWARCHKGSALDA